ncbi:MAG TPA: hypothetical protein VFS77_18410 [Pyrinomonadaceae bacterium]|nr:hypothetical protein [Pyrinomonadaceae bacterium]
MRYHSAIYGLRIHLNERVPGLKFSTLNSGTPDLQIDFGALPAWFENKRLTRELRYVRPNSEPSAKPRLAVWSVGDHYHLQYLDGTEFLVDGGGTRVWATWPADTLTLEDTATYLLGPIMGFVLLLRGFVSLHACAVAINDRAIAIVGPAGSGKSTTAAAFAELGYAILAEDVVTLRDRGDEFLVQPGYPSIRLWPSSVEALYGSAATLPKLTPTWDKCYLDLTQEKYEFQQQPLPLGGIYLLGERSDQAAPSISEIAPAERLMSLVANTYATYLMDKTMRAREFEILNRILNSVPVKRVTPHSDPRRIGELCETIIKDV